MHNHPKSGFPDPLAPKEDKDKKSYGLQYAKAIESQWGKLNEKSSIFGKRNDIFERNRKYANGTQDTSIYKQLLNSLQPNSSDGSLLNLDFTPVPILPKFVRIVVNKILSRDPYPNLEAVDPLSSSEKNQRKNRLKNQVILKDKLKELKENTGGIVLDEDPDNLPDTLEEAEIFLNTNVKTDAEIAAQIGTEMTLSWNKFNDNVFRRCVNDLASIGIAVTKRTNDPNYGIMVEYVDPAKFIHSLTEDPSFSDVVYAGHIKTVPLHELIRTSNGELTEDDIKKIKKVAKKKGNDYNGINTLYSSSSQTNSYDEYMVDVLDFEFLSVDPMYFEEKENKYGNTGFYYEGYTYKEKSGSVYERRPRKMDVVTVYEGRHILNTNYIVDYKRKANVPKNMHDISRARLSYSVVATNMLDSMPKSMVDGCVGFADMLQITHLKIQQAIAKAKPDGLIIDIEGLENVQLGKGGELQPLDLHDIYEQTGVFYYRSKNPEGGFQNPPVREINNSIRNINELIGLYNHYLRLIRDATGINEAMDASSPKGSDLVGVRQQAISAGNNAIYDITNASMMLYKGVCEDVVKCLQIIPMDSVLMRVYQNAIGKENMKVLTSFRNLPMYNFGVQVHKDLEDTEKQYLEQNIQIALSQKEIDLEDAMAIRDMRDVNQAERLLVVRRKKRMKQMQEMAQQNAMMQSQQAQQAAQAASQAKQQEMQVEAQIEAQKMQLKTQLEIQLEAAKHEMQKEIEMIRAKATLGFRTEDQEFKEKIEVLKEDRKDDRVKKQAVEQSKLMSQRKDQRGELTEESEAPQDSSELVKNIIDGIQ
jgi:hypothetical protein